jgi:hypothetical protein
MPSVLALDPGETTGYVAADYEFRTCDETIIIAAATEGTWTAMAGLHSRLYLFDTADFIVAEDYIIYPNRAKSHTGDRVYTAQEIGRIRWLAYANGLPVAMQPASMAKQRWPDERLREKLGRMPPNHICDAWRHLFTYLEKRHDDAYIEIRRSAGG